MYKRQVWGRAAALGEPTAALVAATFGVFEPTMIGAVYEAGVAAVPRADILAARADGAAESIEAVASAHECAAIADPLLTVLDGLDGLGRPLFSEGTLTGSVSASGSASPSIP